jgi:hypothetical protein
MAYSSGRGQIGFVEKHEEECQQVLGVSIAQIVLAVQAFAFVP